MKRNALWLIALTVWLPLISAAPVKKESPQPEPVPTAISILESLVSKINNVKTAEMRLRSWERINGKDELVYNEVYTKLNVRPFKVYIKALAAPHEGVEIVYNRAEYETKAVVNPGGIIPNVRLDPYGKRMRADQHHTIMESGFQFVKRVIASAVSRAKADAKHSTDEIFKYTGDVTWEGMECYKIEITDPTFGYVKYTVKEGEDINYIERRDKICGYLIIDKNDGVNKFTDLEAGMVIKKPTSYAKKTELYIDKKYHLPVRQVMYDEVGVFEKYEFVDLKINPTFTATEFTKDYSGYKF